MDAELTNGNITSEGVSWEEWGQTVKRVRESRGMTVVQLADMVGCSETNIYNYEKGEIDNAFYKFIKKVQLVLGIADHEMPGAISRIDVDYYSASSHHKVNLAGTEVEVIASRKVEGGRQVGYYDYTVMDSGGQILRQGPLYQAAISAVKKFHANRIAKLRKDREEPGNA